MHPSHNTMYCKRIQNLRVQFKLLFGMGKISFFSFFNEKLFGMEKYIFINLFAMENYLPFFILFFFLLLFGNKNYLFNNYVEWKIIFY